MYRIAKSDYLVAIDIWSKKEQDDYFLAITCYHIQQCIEKCLKTLITQKGEQFKWTHDIGLLCARVELLYKDDEVVSDIVNKIYEDATMYTTWESKSRYNIDFNERKSKIDIALGLCQELLDVVRETIE